MERHKFPMTSAPSTTESCSKQSESSSRNRWGTHSNKTFPTLTLFFFFLVPNQQDLWTCLDYGHYFVWRIFFSQNLFFSQQVSPPKLSANVRFLCKKNKILKLYTLVQLMNFFWSNGFSRTTIRIHSIVQSLRTAHGRCVVVGRHYINYTILIFFLVECVFDHSLKTISCCECMSSSLLSDYHILIL